MVDPGRARPRRERDRHDDAPDPCGAVEPHVEREPPRADRRSQLRQLGAQRRHARASTRVGNEVDRRRVVGRGHTPDRLVANGPDVVGNRGEKRELAGRIHLLLRQRGGVGADRVVRIEAEPPDRGG